MTMKDFTLTKYSPLNTVVRDEHGTLYKISTPLNIFHGTTTVTKRTSTSTATSATPAPSSPTEPDTEAESSESESESFGLEEIARINWHYWSGTKVVYRGEIMEINALMPPGTTKM